MSVCKKNALLKSYSYAIFKSKQPVQRNIKKNLFEITEIPFTRHLIGLRIIESVVIRYCRSHFTKGIHGYCYHAVIVVTFIRPQTDSCKHTSKSVNFQVGNIVEIKSNLESKRIRIRKFHFVESIWWRRCQLHSSRSVTRHRCQLNIFQRST